MTFVSYAQNFEDVMLWRALGHVPRGFYIDVGAWSPDVDSVTRAFYERGWRGINIEPQPEYHALLQKRRPEDINLALAIGDLSGMRTLHRIGNPGLSTLDASVALRHEEAGWTVEPLEVRMETLEAIWRGHVPDGQAVHFLKVDVEGLETAVLRSNDWQQNRPWVVVVEATRPMSQDESHSEWESVLLEADYRIAYLDGLNRFYVAGEHVELMPAFRYPPNVFDQFVVAGAGGEGARAMDDLIRGMQQSIESAESRAVDLAQREAELIALVEERERRAAELKQEGDAARSRLAALEAELTHSEMQVQALVQRSRTVEDLLSQREQECVSLRSNASEVARRCDQFEAACVALRNSLSWRLTAPLRLCGSLILHPSHTFRSSMNALQHPLSFAMAAVLRRPQLSYRINRVLMRYPALHRQLLDVARRQGVISGGLAHTPPLVPKTHEHQPVDETLAALTPRAREIYADLKAAIENNKKSD